YVPVTRSSTLLFVTGKLSTGPNGLVRGHLGKDLDVTAGQKAAELCAVNILGQIAAITPLENVTAILRLTVLVASMPDFSEQHLVANGASELFINVLGQPARHARAAF